MLDYRFFYDVVKYAEAWKGFFTEAEQAEQAHIFTMDWYYYQETGDLGSSKALMDNLAEDVAEGIEEARELLETIREAIEDEEDRKRRAKA